MLKEELVTLFGRWFFVSVIGFSFFVTFAFGATLLPADEVNALREIAKKLGKTGWDFDVDPCNDKGEGGWVTPKKGEFENSAYTDDKFGNSVTCYCSNNIVCNVDTIVLTGQDLQGVLPVELVKLPNLRQIDLTRNYLNGTIPREWATMKLVDISLNGNRLSGSIPKELGSMTTLEVLTLNFNRLSGTLPPELGNLVNLKRFLINSNYFTGKLPETLAKLTTLTDFRISDNNFLGNIPNFIQKWTNVTRLRIQASGLEGPIPPGIFHLKNLKDVRISDINGSGWTLPRLSNMTKIEIMILRSCNLTGELTEDLGEDLATMKNLITLDLSFNKLRGEIPSSFDKISEVKYIYLTGNLLTGFVPSWIRIEGKNIDLSYNNFTWENIDECQERNVNMFKSSSLGKNSLGVDPCLKSLPCSSPNLYSFHINCGGKKVVNGSTIYEEDIVLANPSMFSQIESNNWAFSSTGHFMDNGEGNDYIVENKTLLLMENTQLYETARLSPLSLTYYGFCLLEGNYTVILHFAEIVFTNNKTYKSLGRRIFDVYIQGKLVLKDFNIKEAAGGAGKEVKRNFTANVASGTLEIRFYWAGKGTTRIPSEGNYGPLISAISVDPDFEPPLKGGKKMSGIVIVGIVALILCILFMIMAILWWKGCLGRKHKRDQDLRGIDLQTGSFTLRQIKAATNNFDAVNKIGEGGFGPVYKGLLSDGTMIAVKQLSSKSKQGNREFVNEIGMISSLQHPNLVRLYGCCTEGNQLLLVYEYLENNSLARALFGPAESRLKLDWPTRHKICVGIARGLAYLHEESSLKIVHRDIKAANVLLDKDINPKISDFGLAKLDEGDSTHMSTRIAGTYGYMAPEYAMRGHLTDKADVYSFGVVALEIVSGRSSINYRPNADTVYLLDLVLVLQEKGCLMELVDPRLEEFNKKEAMDMINVALQCTNASSILRPTMSAVVSMLQGQTVVEEFVSDPGTSSDDLKFKAISNHYKQIPDWSMGESQKQSMPSIGSSISAHDLYPSNMDSQHILQGE